MLLAALLADAGDDGALDPADDVSSIVEFLDRGDDGLDFRLGGVRLHYNNHESLSLQPKLAIATDYIRIVLRSKACGGSAISPHNGGNSK